MAKERKEKPKPYPSKKLSVLQKEKVRKTPRLMLRQSTGNNTQKENDVLEYQLKNIDISSLIFDETNPNKTSQEIMRGLRKSIQEFGFLKPVVINEKNEIVEGEHRALAMKLLGRKQVQCYIVPRTNDDIKRRQVRQTLNKLHGEHEIKLDAKELAIIFRAGQLDDLAELIAQKREYLENILEKHEGISFDGQVENFSIEKTLEDLVPQTELGDMWQLGNHRIICADCTDRRSILKLLGDKKIQLCVTSPPYDRLRNYDGNNSFDFNETCAILYEILQESGTIVWIVGDETEEGDESGSSFKQALGFKDAGFKLHDTMIWNKASFRFPSTNFKRYHQVFEYMFILVKGQLKTFNPIKDRENIAAGQQKRSSTRANPTEEQVTGRKFTGNYSDFGMRFNIWRFDIGYGSVYTTKEANIVKKHPAVFPTELAADHIKSWSNQQDFILDPFLGSGSTLIACEQSKRNCFGIDLNPRYIDLTVKRWEAFTKRKAKLLSND